MSEIFLKESKDPRFERVTISRVKIDKGVSFAQVYFSIYPPEDIDELTDSLNNAAGFFSNCLGHALKTKHTPRLVFIYDKGFDYSWELDKVLKQISDQK
ncbi:MAG: 30S ribosome-binding factor RbfA [SAR324 cluster bacterium]|nr:30S ribosome-binding factor RbfA [SAR324 cluster bacterium]